MGTCVPTYSYRWSHSHVYGVIVNAQQSKNSLQTNMIVRAVVMEIQSDRIWTVHRCSHVVLGSVRKAKQERSVHFPWSRRNWNLLGKKKTPLRWSCIPILHFIDNKSVDNFSPILKSHHFVDDLLSLVLCIIAACQRVPRYGTTFIKVVTRKTWFSLINTQHLAKGQSLLISVTQSWTDAKFRTLLDTAAFQQWGIFINHTSVTSGLLQPNGRPMQSALTTSRKFWDFIPSCILTRMKEICAMPQ
jgi:hypothetical protein